MDSKQTSDRNQSLLCMIEILLLMCVLQAVRETALNIPSPSFPDTVFSHQMITMYRSATDPR